MPNPYKEAARIGEIEKEIPQGGPAVVRSTLRLKVEKESEDVNNDNKHKKILSYMRKKLFKDLEKFQVGLGKDLEYFLEQNPEWACAVDGLSLRPTITLAATPLDEERRLVTRRDLPEKAPALWATDKQPGDSPPDFIQRHYGPWLGKGLSRPDIDRCDHTLYVALGRWLEKPGNSLPFDLPTKQEIMQREASHLLPEEVRETQRQLSRQQRRLKHISRDQ